MSSNVIDPADLGAIDAASAIRNGTLTSVRLVESCLERIWSRDDVVQAFAHIDADGAMAAARAADASEAEGLLHGVPIAIKDIIDVYGLPTRFNSPIYPNYVPRADSACAAMIREAGGIILGKTVTTEFANRHPGPTTNPWDPGRTPGGSSSGSAAAVGARMVPLAIGTQTSGSVIRPAAFCGTVGYKPSFNEVSRVGVKQQSGSLDTVGWFARSVADIALLHAVLTISPFKDPVRPDRPLKVALCRTAEWNKAEPEARAAVEAAAAALQQSGADLQDFVLPAVFEGWSGTHRQIANYEAARNFGFEKVFHRDNISRTLLKGRIENGEKTTLAAYADAQRHAESMRLAMEQAFEPFDVVLTQAAAGEAPTGLSETGSAGFNSLWTMLYTPCVTIPWGRGANGLPLGVQLVGPRFEDDALLRAASVVEALSPS